MGQGGIIKLINNTDSDWNLYHIHSYQMASWNFPKTIPAKTTADVYVEWGQRIFTNMKDDAGEAVYSLKDGSRFEVQARAKKSFNLQIALSKINTIDNSVGSVLSLGWKHNGTVLFQLSGTTGTYSTSECKTESWMQDHLPLLGNVPLNNMCMVGTHDAGMSVRTSGTPFGRPCNTLTQTTSVGGQLKLGSRYFDIRPVITGGHYYTGHYGYISALNSWQGANGQSIASIINDINNFTANHNELIILNLSHCLNTDVGNNSYRSFNQDEWVQLFGILQSINHLYDGENDDLTRKTLNHFIKDGPKVLVVVEDAPFTDSLLKRFRLYPYSNFNVDNRYSNTNDLNQMANDQFTKMKYKSGYFLLSWTLTLSAVQAATCVASILGLAQMANGKLISLLYPEITKRNFPNIIYVDALSSKDPVKLALSINKVVNE